MTNEIKILEAAQKHYEYSMNLFRQYNNENDLEMKQILWAACEEESGKADGLLYAYEIITGTKLYQHDIMDELLAIA